MGCVGCASSVCDLSGWLGYHVVVFGNAFNGLGVIARVRGLSGKLACLGCIVIADAGVACGQLCNWVFG